MRSPLAGLAILVVMLAACSGGGGQVDSAVQRHVTVTLAGGGTGTVTSSPPGISCPGACDLVVARGTHVELTAAAAAGSTFLGWMGACTGTAACVLDVTADTAVTAAFGQNHELVVLAGGLGAGTITSDPPGIDCGTDCSEIYPPSTLVTLTPTPDAVSAFAGWTGDCTGTGACTVTMDQARMVVAAFAVRQYNVTVERAGTGAGTVTSAPGGIDCGADCTEPYDVGTVVTLTASPDASSQLVGWAGPCSGTEPCVVTVTGDVTATASFDLVYHTLTVQAFTFGSQGGIVSNPPGTIACGTSGTLCSASLVHGSTITLQIVGSGNFVGWAGDCMPFGSSPTCTLTITADRSAIGYWEPVDAPPDA